MLNLLGGPVPTDFYVALSALIFVIGAVGVLIRRSAIMIFLSVELMLNAANLALVAFARGWAGAGAGEGARVPGAEPPLPPAPSEGSACPARP